MQYVAHRARKPDPDLDAEVRDIGTLLHSMGVVVATANMVAWRVRIDYARARRIAKQKAREFRDTLIAGFETRRG